MIEENKSKILLISHELTVSGAPNSLLRQAMYFKDCGLEVDIWSLKGGNLINRYTEKGFYPLILKSQSYRDIKKTWEKNKKNYALIICNTLETYKCVDILQCLKIPVIWFIRETKLVDEHIKSNKDFKRVFSSFYNIYTVSEYAARILRKYNPNVRVINNAVADVFKRYKKISKPLVFGYIGSISPNKGIEVLIDAFTKISDKRASLIIAGNYYNKLGKKLIEKTKEIKLIQWWGEVQNDTKEKFFDNIDVLVVPSFDEPSGLTVIEGAMYGKIIITTTNVGANYLVYDKKSGYVIPSENVGALRLSIETVLKKSIKELSDMASYSRELYLRYGTTNIEKSKVLKMFEDNKENYPPYLPERKHNYVIEFEMSKKHFKVYLFGKKICSINKGFYRKEITKNGKVHIFIFGMKILSYKSKQKLDISNFKTCKYVHIMNNDKFNKPFCDFLNRNFKSEEHLILYMKMHDHPVPTGNNVMKFQSFAQLELAKNNIQKIIFHSLPGNSVEYLYKHKNILKTKCYWMIWGADLYNAKRDKRNDFVRANFKGYISDTDGDCLVAAEKYNSHPLIYNAGYTFPITIEMINACKKIKHKYTKIQINNSADESTLEMLDVLSKFKDENIRIFTILSYGKMEFVEPIISKGKTIFGSKFEYVNEFMLPEKYAQRIAQNDILILNQNRQQGLGNCFANLVLGTKVFIRSEVTTFKHFNSKGIKIFDTNDIKEMSFKQLKEYPKKIQTINSDKAKVFFDDTYLKQLWTKVFD